MKRLLFALLLLGAISAPVSAADPAACRQCKIEVLHSLFDRGVAAIHLRLYYSVEVNAYCTIDCFGVPFSPLSSDLGMCN